MLSISERLKEPMQLYRRLISDELINLRVGAPGIITSFNPSAQTATVQLAIREKININGNETWTDVPELLDVPVKFPRAGGYSITFPVKNGDECWVSFGDNCYDAFWQSGGIQNQVEKRRHDLSDATCYPTSISQPNALSGFSTGAIQIRNDAGTAYIEILGSTINIHNSNVNISGGNTTIDGKNFLSHTHGGVQPGGGNTSGVS